MLGISPREILRWSILAIYGLGMWFIYNGITDYITLFWGLNWAKSIAIGVVIIISALAYTKMGVLFN